MFYFVKVAFERRGYAQSDHSHVIRLFKGNFDKKFQRERGLTVGYRSSV